MATKNAELNKKVPAFKVPCTGIETFKLADYKGKKIILYFYPKDSTPGCTREGQDFRDNMVKFKRRNAIVFGVSRDKLSSHQRFIEKQKFNFDLLADEDETVCKLFGVIKLKNMYGKKLLGIERSTFLIDENGKLCKEWRKVKVEGHVEEVLKAVKDI